jgi:hypothetical protein
VAECKVLSAPTEASRLRNVASKLGPEDAESFRAKLRRKVEWAERLGRNLVPTFDGAMGLIVLDRFWPGSLHDEGERVVDLEFLDAMLRALAERSH